jgi:hypothetical protein
MARVQWDPDDFHVMKPYDAPKPKRRIIDEGNAKMMEKLPNEIMSARLPARDHDDDRFTSSYLSCPVKREQAVHRVAAMWTERLQ